MKLRKEDFYQGGNITRFSLEKEIIPACDGGNWQEVDLDLMLLLERISVYSGGVLINKIPGALWADGTGHSEGSCHYRGTAADIVVCQQVGGHAKPRPLREQWVIAARFQVGGLGIYPCWRTPGLHLDTRLTGTLYPEARWWRDKKGLYRKMEGDDLKEIFDILRR